MIKVRFGPTIIGTHFIYFGEPPKWHTLILTDGLTFPYAFIPSCTSTLELVDIILDNFIANDLITIDTEYDKSIGFKEE